MKIGPFSRGGMARGQAAVHAADHDMQPLAVLCRQAFWKWSTVN